LRRVDGSFQLEYPIGTPIIRPIDQASPFRFSPRGDKLAIQGDEGLALIDRGGRKLAGLASAVPSQLAGLAWDGDDALWVLAGESQTARSIWRVTLYGEAREVYRSVGQLGTLHDASPDGRRLLHQGFERFGVRAKLRAQDHDRELGVFSWSGVMALSDDGQQLGVTIIEAVLLTPDGQGYAYTYARFLQDLFVVGLRDSGAQGP
jgi:hypothetical protein